MLEHTFELLLRGHRVFATSAINNAEAAVIVNINVKDNDIIEQHELGVAFDVVNDVGKPKRDNHRIKLACNRKRRNDDPGSDARAC
jgi:hypothetical protein